MLIDPPFQFFWFLFFPAFFAFFLLVMVKAEKYKFYQQVVCQAPVSWSNTQQTLILCMGMDPQNKKVLEALHQDV